jgi:hypothetical protein
VEAPQGQSCLADTGMHNNAQRQCHRLLEADLLWERGADFGISCVGGGKLARGRAWENGGLKRRQKPPVSALRVKSLPGNQSPV